MGFFKQTSPEVDFPTWSQGTRAEKIRPMARQWAEVGFGTPVALHLFYVVKILAYIACLLYTSPSPRDVEESRMPSSA